MPTLFKFLLPGLLVLVAGCSLGPDLAPPRLEAELPAQWARPTLSAALPGENAEHWRWWEAFGDPTLDGLVASAMAHNNDLAAAVGRVLEAEALLGGARSARLPSVEVGGSATRTKSSESQTRGIFSPYLNSFNASATARYEVDLWGRLSRGQEAALATLLASEQDRRAVAQRLIADVVRTWLEIRELRSQVILNEDTVHNFAENLTTVRDRYRRGLVSSLDVHLAAQNLAAAQAAGPAFRQNLSAARRRLEILAGRYPAGQVVSGDRELSGADHATSPAPVELAVVPAGLPSTLLERRPDLAAAELRFAATQARIGEAKAALYPRLSLTASAGSASNELEDLFTKPADIWSLAGNLLMPLINRGATQAQIKAAEARALQAASQYRSSVLQAFSEVENALDADFFQGRQEAFLRDSVAQAQRSVQRAEERYNRGLDNILLALESQRRLYTAESQLLTTQRQRRTARVNLIQALGGPWEQLDADMNKEMTGNE